MPDTWNPKIYSQFLDLRTRPTRDLLAAVPDSFQPKTVYDLGCGPGNSTVLLKNRWPAANVIGLDSSSNMLEQAAVSYPNIQFIKGDIAQFRPAEKIDCLFANASLQCLDDHATLIPKLINFLNKGGLLAIQMPNNFHSASHQVTIKLLQNNPEWQVILKNLRYGKLEKPFFQLTQYYDLLTNAGLSAIQLWETEYFQEMSSYQDIFDWVKGTALRSVLSAMDNENQQQFASEYIKAIAREYPKQLNQKIFLPFKRVFMLGWK